MRNAPTAGMMTKKMSASILFSGINRLQKTILVETWVLFGKVFRQVQGDDFDDFVFSDWSLVFFGQAFVEDAGERGVVLFSHVMILIDFVVIVKLFSQVFCNLGFRHDFEMARVEQRVLSVVMDIGFVAFRFDDAVDFRSNCPELAFLWCFIFHA
jgi:hypothetical protein